MVDIENDLATVTADMAVVRDKLPKGWHLRDKLDAWITGLDFIAQRLHETPNCPECGRVMSWDSTLQTHVCHHAEDTDTVD